MRFGVVTRYPVLAAAVAVMAAAVATALGASLTPSVAFEQQLLVSRAALIVVAAGLLSLGLYYRAWTGAAFERFFFAASRPLNLAIYRVVLFFTVWADLDHDARPALIKFFANLPKELQVPPPGLGPFLPYLPINQTLATWALYGITAFSFLAMIGLFTRTAAWLAVACMLYGLGIPQFYGQVNHYHHMIWFAAILAASRCADVLSVDSLITAWRRGSRDELLEPPGESRAYALPLRFVWILLGLIYFFPGFWKYWRSGLDWAFSENFKHQLHLKWMQRDGWLPMFRIDHYPLLYMPAALCAVVWELSFLPAVFFRPTRIAVACVGAMFHAGTRFLMHISFWTLQTSYVSLFNWDGIFRNLGRRLYREELLFLYDGADPAVRRRLATWRTLDVFFGRVRYVDLRDTDAGEAMTDIGATAGVRVLHYERSGAPDNAVPATAVVKSVDGRSAWMALARRIPPLWPLWPLLAVLPAPRPRASKDARPSSPAAGRVPWTPSLSCLKPAVAVFTVLLLGNLAFGLRENRTGYPFTCYPPFSRILGPEAKVIRVEARGRDGRAIEWDEQAFKKRFSSARYVSLVKNLRDTRDRRRMHAFWEVMKQHNPQLRQATRVIFWETTVQTDPRHRGAKPIHQELVYSYTEDEGVDGADPAAVMPPETLTSTDTPEAGGAAGME